MSGRKPENATPESGLVIPPAIMPRVAPDGRVGIEIGPYFLTLAEARAYAAIVQHVAAEARGAAHAAVAARMAEIPARSPRNPRRRR